MDNDRLKRLIADEDAYFANRPGLTFWEDYELGLLPIEAKNLMNARLIKMVFRSNKTRGYRVDREAVQEHMRQQETINEMFHPENAVPDDLFRSIINYDELKDLFRIAIKSDRNMGILMIGPPASAKSMFLLELSRLPGARYITASSATKSGLVDILLDDEPKYLLVDELDKANARDYDALLSLMETGIVQRNQHSLHTQKVLKTKVFAACNSDRNIPPELGKSRMVPLRFHAYNTEELKTIGVSILTTHEGLAPDIARTIVNMVVSKMGIVDPRDFLKVARLRAGDDVESIETVITILKRYS